MSTTLVTVGIEEEITDVLRTMSDKGARAIVDDRGRLRGIICIDDVIGVLAAEVARLARLIQREQTQELEKTDDPFRDEFAA
ncbi:MAG TPA: CBS domain-containing protein [Burkholderiales bacterium]|nr:CBS domain-containing protein [Burkholderiales bacterium]